MTDTSKDIDIGAIAAKSFEERADFQARAETARPGNKTALFDALTAAGIACVIVTFDGYGDSGQVEDITAHGADGEGFLPQPEAGGAA